MFNPSRDQVRSFFIDTWRKARAKEVLTPMETIAWRISIFCSSEGSRADALWSPSRNVSSTTRSPTGRGLSCSVITRSAPADALTVSRAKQVSIPGWKRPVKAAKRDE